MTDDAWRGLVWGAWVVRHRGTGEFMRNGLNNTWTKDRSRAALWTRLDFVAPTLTNNTEYELVQVWQLDVELLDRLLAAAW